METVSVSLDILKAEKDVIDAVIIAAKDLKAGKAGSLIADEFPSIIKIGGEFGELMAELKNKQSFVSLAYLAQQILSL